jgi:serine O-acetyltransferase
MIRDLVRDAVEMARVAMGAADGRAIAKTMLLDSFAVMALTRAREAARRYHVPGVNRLLRLTQMTIYGTEIGKDVTLGHGVYLVHTLGVVIGGHARVGKRVRFMGNNTVGTAKDNGWPIIEDDVTVGAGARILGPIRIGAGAQIGANAVVISDIPRGAVAVGIPARVKTIVKQESDLADEKAAYEEPKTNGRAHT